jgi:hypothetical protein
VKGYSPVIEQVLRSVEPPPLKTSLVTGGRAANPKISKLIEDTLSVDLVAPCSINSSIHVDLIKSALFLWNDDFELAHEYAQSAQNAEGSYWHAILHRREPDFSNANYWYSRVGSHPVFHKMAQLYSGWKPDRFLLQCQKKKSKDDVSLLLETQVKEFELLFDHTYHEAVRKP